MFARYKILTVMHIRFKKTKIPVFFLHIETIFYMLIYEQNGLAINNLLCVLIGDRIYFLTITCKHLTLVNSNTRI